MSAELDRSQTALGRIIREPELRARLEADPDGLLRELGLDDAERAGMLELGVRRLLAYNQMVFTRLARTVQEFMPRVSVVVGTQAIDDDVREWIAAVGSRSPYLREVPREFFAWVEPRWSERIAAGSLPAWLLELAEHELLLPELRNDPRAIGSATEHKIELERGLAANPTARLIRRRFAVHRLPTTLAEVPSEIDEGSFVLLGWRDAADRARVIELEPRAAALLERLLAGLTLRDALFGACAAVGEALDDAILQSTALTLADLCDRHVLLGGA